jgi:hypothetical protein
MEVCSWDEPHVCRSGVDRDTAFAGEAPMLIRVKMFYA